LVIRHWRRSVRLCRRILGLRVVLLLIVGMPWCIVVAVLECWMKNLFLSFVRNHGLRFCRKELLSPFFHFVALQ
jgi:hypothetical protein